MKPGSYGGHQHINKLGKHFRNKTRSSRSWGKQKTVIFYNPTPTQMAFIVVTNSYVPQTLILPQEQQLL